MSRIDGFTDRDVDAGDTHVAVSIGGNGAPVLLLHGFPQTRAMWRSIAPRLAERHSVIAADLTGYGASGCPPSDEGHARYSKRAIAADMVRMMAALGHGRFAVIGHDRGGRVAYRLALDHNAVVTHVAALDVLPSKTVWDRADDRFALGFWPFVLLAQEPPLPERVLTILADTLLAQALDGGWGTPGTVFDAAIRAAYVEQLRDPAHAHAICEEYRAAAGIDREHDAVDQATGKRIAAPLLALWSAAGPLGSWYEEDGGPLALWRDWAEDVRGQAVPGGHFFPEESPEATADRLLSFLGDR